MREETKLSSVNLKVHLHGNLQSDTQAKIDWLSKAIYFSEFSGGQTMNHDGMQDSLFTRKCPNTFNHSEYN